MTSQSAPQRRQISRPLPHPRLSSTLPPRGTVYVVERLGRFSRLLYPNRGPPLLPLVDRVIASYATKRIDQFTPVQGVLALLSNSTRVYVHAAWSLKVMDPKKLAYRIGDVDRCVDMLMHVRIRDAVGAVLDPASLDKPKTLSSLGDTIRVGVEDTASKFGVSCQSFKLLSVRPVDNGKPLSGQPQHRSLNLAQGPPAPDQNHPDVDSVLPELPQEHNIISSQPLPSSSAFVPSFPTLPPAAQLPPQQPQQPQQPQRIIYLQPIAYPQPPQMQQNIPSLANVRLPPSQPQPRSRSITEIQKSPHSLQPREDESKCDPQPHDDSSAVKESASAHSQTKLPNPRQVLYAPPPSPQVSASLPDTDRSPAILPGLVTRALVQGSETSQTNESSVDDLPSPHLPQSSFSPPLAKYIHGLPPTPRAELPPSETGSEIIDDIDRDIGQPLPMETRLPGITGVPGTDDDEYDEQDGDRSVFVDSIDRPESQEVGLQPPLVPEYRLPGPAKVAGAVQETGTDISHDGTRDLYTDTPTSPPSSGDPNSDQTASRELPPLFAPTNYPQPNPQPPQGFNPAPSFPMNNSFTGHTNQPMPVGVGQASLSEVDARSKRAMPLGPGPPFNDVVREEESDSSTAAVIDRNMDGDWDGTNAAMHPKLSSENDASRKERRRRQHTQTTSLFQSVVGRTERVLKSGASLTSDLMDGPLKLINARANTTRIKGSPPPAGKGSRLGLPSLNISRKGSGLRQVPGRETRSRPAENVEALQQTAVRSVPPFKDVARKHVHDSSDSDDAVMREKSGDVDHEPDTNRLRSTEEEETLSRKEHTRRERMLETLNHLEKSQADIPEDDSHTSDGSTEMWVDGASDEERRSFTGEAVRDESQRRRRKRSKSRHHRSNQRDGADAVVETSSDEDICEDCGHHKHHEASDYSGSSRSGRSRSRSRSRRSESVNDESEKFYEHRSRSHSRSGRDRKASRDRSVDSHRSGHSSRDRSHRKKSSSRDRERTIDKERSERKGKSSDRKRSHSRSRSRKGRDADGERKRKSGKSKSRHHKHTHEDMLSPTEYFPRDHGLVPIYRHRPAESDSGEENPIPWYCEGQSAPEDTDVEDYGQHSSDSDSHMRSRKTTATMGSSYGRRDRYGRRHRAAHNRTVTFLYGDQVQ